MGKKYLRIPPNEKETPHWMMGDSGHIAKTHWSLLHYYTTVQFNAVQCSVV